MKKLFYVLVTFAIFMSSRQESFAQLFSKTKLPEKLNSKQEKMLAKIYKHPDTKSVDFVKIKSPKKLSLKNRQIELSFEDKGITKVVVDVKRFELEANDDYVWFGQTFLQEDFVQILLIKKGSDVFGKLEYNGRSFQIYGLGEDISALIELKPLDEKNDVCKPVLPTKLSGDTPEIINPCSGFGINIILFFTPEAQSITPDLSQFAHTCVQHYNSSLVGNGSNSAATDRNNFLVLKGAEVLNGFSQTNFAIRGDLDEFNDDPTANARQLSPAISADLKILITNANYGGTLGIAFLNAEVGFSSGIVQQRAAIGFGGGHTFSHEVGHLLGADHDLIDEVNPRPGFEDGFNHGIFVDVNFGWFGQRKRRFGTVMCTPNLLDGDNVGGSREWRNMVNFSSPMQSVSGATLGNTTSNDNTRAILDNAPRVRGLTNAADLTVGLLSPWAIERFETYALEPIINCGNGPFTSEWKMFVNGSLLRTETLANDAQFSFFASPEEIPWGGYVEIYLKVTSSTNQIANAYSYIPVFYGDFIVESSKSENSLQNKSNSTELIYPNPVSDKFIFEYDLLTPSIVDFSIFNSNGMLMQNKKVENTEGHFYQKFDVSTMPTGIYLLKTLIDKKTVTQKFSIVR